MTIAGIENGEQGLSVRTKLNAVINAVNASDDIQQVSVSVTADQILDMHNTPVELLAAPGAGRVTHPISLIVTYLYGVVAYTATGGNYLRWQYDGSTATLSDFGAMLMETESQTGIALSAQASEAYWAVSAVENVAIVLGLQPGTQFLNGDGTLEAIMTYQVIDLP